MSEEYKPIDMSEYPYKQGDKVDNGIVVINVIKGTDKDSFGGYKFRELEGVTKRLKPIWGETIILQKIEDGAKGHPDTDNHLKFIGPVGDPQNQWVYYKKPGDKYIYRMRPEEFLTLAKGGKSEKTAGSTDDETTATKCQGKTKADQPCQRNAVKGEKFCSTHAE